MSEYKVGDVIGNYQLGDIVDKPIYGETYIMIHKQGSHALGMKKVIYYALYVGDDVFIPTKNYNYGNNNFKDVDDKEDLDDPTNSLESVNYVVHAIVKPTGGKSKRRKQKGKFKTRRKFNNKRKQRTSKISSRRV